MTTKEQLFADNYLCTFNATDAARKAGYSENTARQQGYENLTKPYIQDYINQKTSAIFDKLGITQEKVIQELAKVAFGNVGDCLQGDWELKDLTEIKPETAAAIKSIRITKNGYLVTMHDKVSALLKLWDIVSIKQR